MPTRKFWDHAIDLKKTFKLQKGRIYSLFNKREEVQNFVENQLKKGTSDHQSPLRHCQSSLWVKRTVAKGW